MAKVIVSKKENFEKAFRQFRMRCKQECVLKEYRERQFYTKPSQKRRKKNANKKRKPAS